MLPSDSKRPLRSEASQVLTAAFRSTLVRIAYKSFQLPVRAKYLYALRTSHPNCPQGQQTTNPTNNMNILVTGANGQLGNEMRVIANTIPDATFFFTDVEELDICNRIALHRFVADNRINLIVNCAAYTAVDKAEDDTEMAFKINASAVENIAVIANKNNAKVIHISTDYVFDGSAHIPYRESDPTAPLGVYGKTKLQGEQLLFQYCPDAIIIRTSWLYSSFGNNFVKTMIRLGAERESLNVIFDQIGTPTYAADLAHAIASIIQSEQWSSGIYHFSNEGVCSWYDFAIEALSIANIKCNVFPIESHEYPVRTQRPHFSVLNKNKIKTTFNITIPHWKSSLERCIRLL